MFIQSVEFQREKDSDWEKGFYIGRCDNDDLDKGTFLDINYQALSIDEKGLQVWNSHFDIDRDIELRLPIEGEFAEDE